MWTGRLITTVILEAMKVRSTSRREDNEEEAKAGTGYGVGRKYIYVPS
jgi:hypothetical protein